MLEGNNHLEIVRYSRQVDKVMEAAKPQMLALYGRPPNPYLKAGRCTYKKMKRPKPMVLLATTANMCQHVLSAHLEVVLWNATGQHTPPKRQ